VSRHVAIIIVQQPAEAIATSHLTAVPRQVWCRGDQLVVEPLMIALVMIQGHNSTPIIPNSGTFVTRGIRGTAAQS